MKVDSKKSTFKNRCFMRMCIFINNITRYFLDLFRKLLVPFIFILNCFSIISICFSVILLTRNVGANRDN